jgi:starvation-inducible outer membrane lipoprotein
VRITAAALAFMLSACSTLPHVASAGGAALTQKQFFSVEDEIRELKKRVRMLEGINKYDRQ